LKDCRLNEYISNDKRDIAFNISMQNCVDETKTDYHVKMRHRLEFCEVWARTIDGLNFTMEMSKAEQNELDIKIN